MGESKISDIVINDKLVLDSESGHRMPPTRVLNLCKPGTLPTLEELLNNEALVLIWAKFKPQVTVLQFGTIDLIMGSLGEESTADLLEVH